MMDITIVKGRDKPLLIPLRWDPNSTGDPANLVPVPITQTVIALNVGGQTLNTSQTGSELTTNTTQSLAKIDTSNLDLPSGIYELAELVIYNPDYPDGFTIAGPGQSEQVRVTVADPIYSAEIVLPT